MEKSLEGRDHDKPKGFTSIVDMEELSQPHVLGKLGFKEKRRKVRIDWNLEPLMEGYTAKFYTDRELARNVAKCF